MSEPIRTRNSYDGLDNRPVHYPDLPAPLEVGTYDNHTHLEIADGEHPMSVAEHLERMRQVNMLGAVQVGVTLREFDLVCRGRKVRTNAFGSSCASPKRSTALPNSQRIR